MYVSGAGKGDPLRATLDKNTSADHPGVLTSNTEFDTGTDTGTGAAFS